MQTSSPHAKRLFTGSLFIMLFLIPLFAACSNGAGSTGNTGNTPTPQSTAGKVGTNTPTPDATPGVVLGPQACPAGIADPAHWQTIINPIAYGGSQHVESGSCGNFKGNSSLPAPVADRRHEGR